MGAALVRKLGGSAALGTLRPLASRPGDVVEGHDTWALNASLFLLQKHLNKVLGGVSCCLPLFVPGVLKCRAIFDGHISKL